MAGDHVSRFELNRRRWLKPKLWSMSAVTHDNSHQSSYGSGGRNGTVQMLT